jgi:carboxypeptidase PM20D1
MKKRYLLLGLLVFVAVLPLRTLLFEPRHVDVAPAEPVQVEGKRVFLRLGKAIQFPTVSFPESQSDATAEGRMAQLLDYILQTFKPLEGRLKIERHPHNLVFRWEGADPSLAPLLLLAHLDVVPVEPGTESDWKFPPFSGAVSAGSIWGRGALDNKNAAFAMLEAIESMVSRNEQPQRGVVIAFGCDEEVGGDRGAKAQAARFKAEGLEPFLILDEGFAVLDGVIDAVEPPVAGIGIAEKGYLTVQMQVEQTGGHASMPAKNTAIGILAAAIAELEENPMSASIDGASARFFDELARAMPFEKKILFANRWLLSALLVNELEKTPSTAATLRTTTAVTQAAGGIAENVLPESATATVNFRIHPRDSVESVLTHVRTTIDDDRVKLSVLGSPSEPSGLSPAEGAPWELLDRTIRSCFEGVIVAPSLVLAATDSRHYAGLSDHVYRFTPMRLNPNDLDRIHGVNERIPTGDYMVMIQFYAQLLRGSSL